MTFLGPEKFVRFEKHQKAFSGALQGAFRARDVLGSFEKRTLGGPFLESPGNLLGPIGIFLNVFSPITQ